MKNSIEARGHESARTFLRIAGPIIAGIGLILIIIGAASFFSAFGGDRGFPGLFWCIFLGMPALFVGIVMCKFGYVGAVIRYMAAETAPVARDTVNYVAEGTQEGVRTIARSVAEGVAEAQAKSKADATQD
jgi:hypothetical protein